MIQETNPEKPGFFYGYVVVAIACLVNLILGGTLYTFSVFFEPLSSEFGWTRAVTSGAFSLYMLLHGFLYIVTGRLNDKFGPKIVMSGCGFFMGLGYILMSTTDNIWQIYLFYGVIIAIGMSGGYVPITSTVTRWFEGYKRRGLMIGISIAGVGIGTMIVPPFATWLISGFGWRTSYTVIGIISLVVIIAAAQFMRRAPEKLQQLSSGKNVPRVKNEKIISGGLSLAEAIRTRQFWLLSISFFGFGLLLQAIMVHIVMHALGLGITASMAAGIFVAVGGLSFIGKISMGAACDRIGNKSVIIISFALMIAALAWLLVAEELWMLILFAAVFGFSYGGLVSVQSPIVADLFGMSSHGAILGVLVSIITIGAAVGPVMAGGIYDATESYYPAFLVCIGFSIIGLILTLFLKPLVRGGDR
ncbi:MFS transporter [Chloroflexota bacterium]